MELNFLGDGRNLLLCTRLRLFNGLARVAVCNEAAERRHRVHFLSPGGVHPGEALVQEFHAAAPGRRNGAAGEPSRPQLKEETVVGKRKVAAAGELGRRGGKGATTVRALTVLPRDDWAGWALAVAAVWLRQTCFRT